MNGNYLSINNRHGFISEFLNVVFIISKLYIIRLQKTKRTEKTSVHKTYGK